MIFVQDRLLIEELLDELNDLELTDSCLSMKEVDCILCIQLTEDL